MNSNTSVADRKLPPSYSETWNECFAGECLRNIRSAPNAEEGLRWLLEHLGKSLTCDRVYVFEHIRNTYEWCAPGVPSGIEQLPYVVKKDLSPWYERLKGGGNIIEPDVEALGESNPVVYAFLQAQQIRTIVLSPMLVQGKLVGLLGADNPPPGRMQNISILFDVLAHFVCSLVGQRELTRLRDEQSRLQNPQQAVTGKTVLLVDDSRELLRLNKRVLCAEGYETLCAATIKEARAALLSRKPDAIILDIDLPDGSGLAFCRELRKSSSIPVIFLTAHSDAETAREGGMAGGCTFLTKPYQLEDLQNAVAAAVERSG